MDRNLYFHSKQEEINQLITSVMQWKSCLLWYQPACYFFHRVTATVCKVQHGHWFNRQLDSLSQLSADDRTGAYSCYKMPKGVGGTPLWNPWSPIGHNPHSRILPQILSLPNSSQQTCKCSTLASPWEGPLPGIGEERPKELWWLLLNRSACLWQLRATLAKLFFDQSLFFRLSPLLIFKEGHTTIPQLPCRHLQLCEGQVFALQLDSLQHRLQTPAKTWSALLGDYPVYWFCEFNEHTGNLSWMLYPFDKISISKLSFLEYFKWEGPESKFGYHWKADFLGPMMNENI